MSARLVLSFRMAKVAFIVCFVSLLAPALHAQQATSRIPEVIDEHNLATLHGNVHPQARPQNDQGPAAGNLPMQRMVLVLKRGETQEKALRAAIQAMHDPSSAQYHHWLTPEQFGHKYGPSDADMARITGWLREHGFQVDRVAQGRGSIEFSGTAAAVESTFHTQIHRYLVKGAAHYANATDPKIPAALTPAVSGVLSLHNFLKQSSARILGKGQLVAGKTASLGSSAAPRAKSDFTFKPNFTGGGSNYVGPGDLWTIYNATPLITAAQGKVDGTGQTIAIVGRSDVSSDDIQGFRKFLLPAPYSTTFPFTQIQNGPDPGQNDDLLEQTLDVEYSSAMAPGAQVDLVVSGSTNTTDGVDLSAQYIVDNNLAPVMSTSYGLCEAELGAGNDFYNALWEQAAAQGITAMVSSGDNGSAGCDLVGPSGDDSFAFVADEGLQVSGIASTPYNVAVGGNQFTNDSSTYWNPNNASSPAPFTSALSYVPEAVWNESCSPLVCGNENANLAAGSGGASGCFKPTLDSTGNYIVSCSGGYATPDWQSGVAGLPGDGKRHLPDVSLTAAGHDGYMVCLNGSCDSGSFYSVGGTSASSPSFAGIMALVNQKTGTRQGQANYTLYRLAGGEYGTPDSPNTSQLQSCSASNGNAVGASCIFQDVTTGTNAVPCDGGTLNCNSTTAGDYGVLTGYNAGSGYDSATGLGSVNISNLVNHWNDTTQTGTTTTLSLGGATSTFGSPLTIAVAVKPSTGSGVPTGDVALTTDSSLPGAVGAGSITLSGGSYSGTISSLPGGTYNVFARYAGDSTYSSSTSAASKITVAPAGSAVHLAIAGLDPIAQQTVSGTKVPYGSVIVGSVTLGGVSGLVAPSGTVTFYKGNTKLADLTSAPDGTAAYSLPGYAVGSYSWKAAYGGNTNYHPSTSAPVAFNVGQASTGLRLVSNTSYVVGSNSAAITAIITDHSLLANPTGSVTLTVNGKAVGTVAVVAYTDPSTGASEAKATFTVDASVLSAGANTLTASYTGDSNYLASASSSLSVGYGTTNAANTIALTANPASPSVDHPVTLIATVTTGGIAATAGTVQFFDGANLIGTAQVAGSAAAAGHTAGTATLALPLGLGQHSLSARYLGILAAPTAVTSAPVALTVHGPLASSLTIAAAPDASNAANFDLTGTVTGFGFAVPTASVDFAETSVVTDLGSASVDPKSAIHTLASPGYMSNGVTGAFPAQTVLADFNNDGILDMATANASFTGGTMSILIGNGDGTFKSPVTYPAGLFTSGISSGDFNNDGIVDIVLTSQYDLSFGHGFSRIYLGNGDGTFRQATDVHFSGYPVGTVVGDFNRDGVLDIAALEFIPGQVSVAFGNGDGTFQAPVDYAVNAGFGSEYAIAMGDFNGDGIPDLVEANANDNTLGIFMNNGDGTFGPQITVNTNNPEWISVADLNGDGKQDLIVSNYGNQTMGVLLGNGDSTFKPEVDYPLNGLASSLALADLDGDGKLDAAAGFFYPQVGVGILKGNGDGTFGAETDYATHQGHGYAVSLGDLNGDGTPDLVSADINSGDSSSQSLAIMLNVTRTKATLSNIAIAGPVAVTQQVQGVYAGDANYAASTSPAINLAGSGAKATPAISWNPASPWGAGVALGTNVLNATVAGNIAGAITYTAQPAGGAATAINTATTLAAGTYTLTANFTPVDAVDYTTATATRALTVQPADFTIEASTSSLTITAGSSGSVSVSVPSLYGFSGTVTLAGAAPLPGGFTVTASPATITAGGSSTVTIQTTGLNTASAVLTGKRAGSLWITGGGIALSCLLILPLARRRKAPWIAVVIVGSSLGLMNGCGGTSFSNSSVTLTTSASKIASGSSVTLTAAVSSKNHSPEGNVTFYNGSTALGPAVPVVKGSATLSVTSLPVGLNSLTAVYSGDSHNSAATSSALDELVTGQAQVSIQGASGSEMHTTTISVTLQ